MATSRRKTGGAESAERKGPKGSKRGEPSGNSFTFSVTLTAESMHRAITDLSSLPAMQMMHEGLSVAIANLQADAERRAPKSAKSSKRGPKSAKRSAKSAKRDSKLN